MTHSIQVNPGTCPPRAVDVARAVGDQLFVTLGQAFLVLSELQRRFVLLGEDSIGASMRSAYFRRA